MQSGIEITQSLVFLDCLKLDHPEEMGLSDSRLSQTADKIISNIRPPELAAFIMTAT
jgi:hypothetical protein